MILKRVTFDRLFKRVKRLFKGAIFETKFRKINRKLFKDVKSLARINFICYQTNMRLIEEWKSKNQNLAVISTLDLRLREYGERRVQKKNSINASVHSVFSKRPRGVRVENWTDIDLAYTIADMVDRLIIETIKIADYKMRLRRVEKNQKAVFFSKKILAEKWMESVMLCLSKKLNNINHKKFYDVCGETRTYDLS